MAGIWYCFLYDVPTVLVPLPHPFGVCHEGINVGKLFGLELRPYPIGRAKRSDAGLLGDSGTGKHYDT